MTTTVRVLTEAQAMEAYRAVVADLAATFGMTLTPDDHPVRQGEGDPAWYSGPVLVQDFGLWYSETAWAVVWEGGPSDWSLLITPQLPEGTAYDCFCSFALSLYPEPELAA